MKPTSHKEQVLAVMSMVLQLGMIPLQESLSAAKK
jgi:hypothetical protein